MNGRQASDDAGLQKSPYFQKPGKCPPIIRNPERRACFTKCFHHPDTLRVIDCHGLFHQARLARASYSQRELTMDLSYIAATNHAPTDSTKNRHRDSRYYTRPARAAASRDWST